MKISHKILKEIEKDIKSKSYDELKFNYNNVSELLNTDKLYDIDNRLFDISEIVADCLNICEINHDITFYFFESVYERLEVLNVSVKYKKFFTFIYEKFLLLNYKTICVNINPKGDNIFYDKYNKNIRSVGEACPKNYNIPKQVSNY